MLHDTLSDPKAQFTLKTNCIEVSALKIPGPTENMIRVGILGTSAQRCADKVVGSSRVALLSDKSGLASMFDRCTYRPSRKG